MEELKVGDKVELKSKHIGTIININEFREPSMKYGIDVEGFSDVVFVGEEQIIRKIEETHYDFQKELQQLREENDYLKQHNSFLRRENEHLSVVKHEHENYIENIHFITENRIKCIEKNRFKIEISEGEFVDIKELKSELEIYKKIAEKLAEEYWFADSYCPFESAEEVIDWARKEVENGK